MPPPLDDTSRQESRQALERARRGQKRPLSVEEERGYRECDVGKKLMRHRWDGLHHKWAAPRLGSDPVIDGGFGDDAGLGRDLLEKVTLLLKQARRGGDANLLAPLQGTQEPSPSAAARVDALEEKLAQMTKVLTKVLHEGGVLQVSTKLMRVLCPDGGSSTPAGGGLTGCDWVLVEEAIDNLVNQTGEGMQVCCSRVFVSWRYMN
jgi:hypothetical protein